MFLSLLQSLSTDDIRLEFIAGKAVKREGAYLSFYKLYEEICDILVKSTGRPDSSDKLWFDALQTLFIISKEHSKSKSKSKRDFIRNGFFEKISDFLQIMSKYVEFDQVVNKLLEIDPDAVFKYAKDWFSSIFNSK